MKGKNVDFNAGKWKNEMTNLGFEPGTFSTKVRCPYPYTTISLGHLAKKIRESLFNALLWQKVANIKDGKFKQGKIQIFKGP